MTEEDVQAAAHAAAEDAAMSNDLRRSAAGAMDAQSRYYSLAHRWAVAWPMVRQGGTMQTGCRSLDCAMLSCLCPSLPLCSNTEEIVEQPKLLRPPNGATLREYQIVGLQVR